MSRTYRLPGSLGGHECTIVDENSSGEVVVRLKVDGLTMTLILAKRHLVKVAPSLPEEPPDGSTVSRVGVIFERSDEEAPDFERRWVSRIHGWWTWAELFRDECTPVLLVPDPAAAGVEPNGSWKCTVNPRDVLSVLKRSHDGAILVAVDGVDRVGQRVWLSREDAESAGRTLLAAARAGA